MKEIFKALISIVLIFLLLFAVLGAVGIVDLQFYKYFGKEKANIDREIFKENKSYNEGMISDLSKYKYEYETESDEIAKKAILSLIRDKFANFDSSRIETKDLRNFLEDVQTGEIK